VEQRVKDELFRIQRNAGRREQRERLKQKQPGAAGGGGGAGSPPASVAGSPGPSDIDGPVSALNVGSTDVTPQKGGGRGRNKDGTARKCANCGQVGHIKTNRKSVYTFICTSCGDAVKVHPGGVVKRNDDGELGGDGKYGAGATTGSPLENDVSRSLVQDSYSKFVL